MPRKISDVIGVTHQTLEKEGAFDGFTDIDAQFHVDPHLLRSVSIPELSNSQKELEQYFEKIIHLLDASQKKGDIFFSNAVRMLTFRELDQVRLGYAPAGSHGNGIGLGLAQKIAETAMEIVRAGIKDPVIFELVGLFQEGVGADRISDMTVSIIWPDILRFSERVATNLSAKTTKVRYDAQLYKLPIDPVSGEPIVLVPSVVLRDLPVALDWDDVDVVCSYNAQLRAKVNKIVGKTWKRAQKRLSKQQLKFAVLDNPELMNDLIAQYKGKTNKQYDFVRDPAGAFVWHDIAKQYASQYPLELRLEPDSSTPLLEVVKKICNHFRQLVEFNGLNQLFYDDKKKLRHERFAQLLFYGVADAYCEANNLDLSREPNAGRGPVDFKMSVGYAARVTVEVKYSSNPRLVTGYTTQLPIYNEAEKSRHSIYVVVRTTKSEQSIKSVRQLHDEEKKKGSRAPEIIVVDGRIRPTASKA